MELPEDEFQLQQAVLRAEIRIQQKRAKAIDYLVTKIQDPILITSLSQSELQDLKSELALFQKSVWFQSLLTIAEYLLKHDKNTEICQMFTGKSLDELIELQTQVRAKLDSDYDYWTRVLAAIEYHQCLQIVSEIYQKSKSVEKKEVQVAKTRFINEPYDPVMEPATVSDIMFRDSKTKIMTQEEFDFSLTEFRTKLKSDLLQYGDRKLVHTHANRKKDSSFMRIACKGIENDEMVLASDSLFDDDYKLVEKYTPRKPVYFVRVETGVVWTEGKKQTRTVPTGYKFNIFYPDLIDPMLAPTFRLENIKEDQEKQLIVFTAGPPYQEIAFHIAKKEWDLSHTKDYLNQFRDNVLQLWFKLKK